MDWEFLLVVTNRPQVDCKLSTTVVPPSQCTKQFKRFGCLMGVTPSQKKAISFQDTRAAGRLSWSTRRRTFYEEHLFSIILAMHGTGFFVLAQHHFILWTTNINSELEIRLESIYSREIVRTMD